jgi:predicted ATP-dependent protease
VILPAENKMNVQEDLSPEQLENLTVHYVKSIDEALQVALPKVAESPAAKILTAPPKDPSQDYNPTQPVKEPERVHDKVLTQA